MALAVTMIGTTYHASCFVGLTASGDSRLGLVDMICGWFVVLPLTLSLPCPETALPLSSSHPIDQCFKVVIAFIRLRG